MKINIVANFVGTCTLIIFPAIFFPLYMKVLDAEKYGLFSFYFVIILYSKILDLGATSTFNRYIAYGENKDFVYKLLKNIEFVFITFAVLIFFLLFVFSDNVINQWLETKTIDQKNIFFSIIIITLIVCLRFFISIYRGGLNGLEKQVWSNLFRVLFELFNLSGGIVIIYIFNYLDNFRYEFNIYNLFLYFLLITFIEFIFFRIKLLKSINYFNTKWLLLDFSPLKNILQFMSMSAISASSWFLVNWFDRIIFSGILNLKFYGYYVTLTLLSSVSLLLVVPINTALLPRITKLWKLKNFEQINFYLNIIFLINFSIIIGNAIIISIYSHEVLLLWTGNFELADWGSGTLKFYNIGYCAAALTNTLTIYCFATARLKFLTIVNLIWALITIVLFIIAANFFDVFIAGIFWSITNFFLFIIFIIYFYNLTKKEVYWSKILINITKVILIAVLMLIINFLIKDHLNIYNRLIFLLLIGSMYLLFLIICIFSINELKKLMIYYIKLGYKRIS